VILGIGWVGWASSGCWVRGKCAFKRYFGRFASWHWPVWCCSSKRSSAGRGQKASGQIYRIADPHSFPSGHAARAMGLAVLAVQSGSAWVVAGFMFWAVLVGLSRITLKLHYLLDVVAGWLIGAAGGVLALQLYPWFSQTIKALLH